MTSGIAAVGLGNGGNLQGHYNGEREDGRDEFHR
jgi:hypothetical protein